MVSDIKERKQETKVLENRVLRKVFVCERKEVTGEWR